MLRTLRGIASTIAVGAVCAAPSIGAENDKKTTATSGDDFTHDQIILRTNTSGFTSVRTGKKETIGARGTKLRVIKDPPAGEDDAGTLTVEIESVPCVPEKDNEGKETDKLTNRPLQIGVGGLVNCASFKKGELVASDEAYTIPRDTLKKFGYYRSGWVYGGLLVPYKYHRHDKSFSTDTTIGPYLGYRMGGLLFLDVAFIASAGLASLSVPDGSGGTSTLQGYTAAIGITGAVTKNASPFRLGFMIGRDWAGSNSATPYPHEGKTWMALQLGFAFEN